MVQLVLLSPKGNQGNKHFPHIGYLGLTPVRVEGVVRTKIDSDHKPIAAKSLTVAVRCYESRQGRFGPTQPSNCLVEHVLTLWTPALARTGAPSLPSRSNSTSSHGSTSSSASSSAPPSPDYASLGEFEAPFRITLPAGVGGFSTANYPDYKIYWRVEAVLEHIPIPGVGTRQIRHFELPLTRYDVPAPRPPLALSPDHYASGTLPHFQSRRKGRFAVLRYSLDVPTEPIGPGDLVSVALAVRPLESGLVIRSATLILERQMEFLPVGGAPAPLEPAATLAPTPSLLTEMSDSTITPSTSTIYGFALTESSTPSSTRPLLPPSSADSGHSGPPAPSAHAPGANVLVSTIASTETAGATFARTPASDSASSHSSLAGGETWARTLTAQWPAARSTHRWAVGERMAGKYAAVRFVVRVRLALVSPAGGAETLELDADAPAHREITVVATTAAERSLALARHSEALAAKKSKSQSPRRRAPPAPEPVPPLPDEAHWEIASARSTSASESDSDAAPPPVSAARRRSAMPALAKIRDKGAPRPPTAPPCTRRPHTSAGPRDAPPRAAGDFVARLTAAQSAPGAGTWAAAPRTVPAPPTVPVRGRPVADGELRAWEAELARIEAQSRRSTADMLGRGRLVPRSVVGGS